MTTHQLPGLHPRSLATYLAALGLIRAVARQTDSSLRAHWHGDELVVDSTIADLASWLVEDYRPAPIVSPWNGGSGFGAKDKKPKEVLDAVRVSTGARVHELRSAIDLAASVLERGQAAGWGKARTVTELRNRCPESLLGWLDACVVVREDDSVFPPLLGTGGNDGRLDFSTNFHQRLVEVIPELGGDAVRSERWAWELMGGGTGERLVSGAVGQFDPAAAGGRNSSPFGAAESLVNPWLFVLLIEGVMYFASGLARRQGAGGDRAAMPFCVYASPDGPTLGAPGETSRGEIWTPVWTQPLAAAEIGQLFLESRASWQGMTASRATEMYAALKSYGVSRSIARFVRYGLHQRNGLAFSAVRLDEINVEAKPAVTLSVEPARVMTAFGRASGGAVVAAKRRFDRNHLAYVRNVRAEDLRDMLAEQTLADLAVLRSTAARDSLGRRRVTPRAGAYVKFLHAHVDMAREFRVGAALASVGYNDTSGRAHPLRQLVVGHLPTGPREVWAEPKVRGLGVRPLSAVLSDAVLWRARQAELAGSVQRGFVPFPIRTVTAPWPDLHAWVAGELDEEAVSRAFLACLALDWRGTERPWPIVGLLRVPHPELAVLQAFASGHLSSSPDQARPAEAGRVGLKRDWPSRFLTEAADTGHLPPSRTGAVMNEAVALLRRFGWSATPPLRTRTTRERIIGALVAGSTTRPLERLGAHLILATEATEAHPPNSPLEKETIRG